jgi:hypothetical protein
MVKTAQQPIIEFTSSRPGLSELVGSKLDNAQFISLLFKGEAERIKDKVNIGNFFNTHKGRKYHISVAGQPAITDSKGQPIAHPGELKIFLEGSRENEINYDSMAHIEVEGEAPSGKRYIGIYYSLADAKLHVTEEAEKGEL